MGWKNLAGWLKGGIIGVVLYIFFALFNAVPLLTFFGNLILKANPSLSFNFAFAFLFGFVIYPLVWFGLGALIGWIVGKIKSRKTQS